MVFEHDLVVDTRGRGTVEITDELQSLAAASGVASGLCNVYITHTSASLIVCENADPAVHVDLNRFMDEFVRDGDPRFVHTAEGPDDMAAHIRSVLTQTSITLPLRDGRIALGTWQGVYLWEHRTRAHRRLLLVTIYGD